MIFTLYWGRVDVLRWVSFRSTARRFNYMYICIYSLKNLFLFITKYWADFQPLILIIHSRKLPPGSSCLALTLHQFQLINTDVGFLRWEQSVWAHLQLHLSFGFADGSLVGFRSFHQRLHLFQALLGSDRSLLLAGGWALGKKRILGPLLRVAKALSWCYPPPRKGTFCSDYPELFFLLKNYFFIYIWLGWIFIAAQAFSSCRQRGLLSSYGARASH